MEASRERPVIQVEGPDDEHSIRHLLIRHDIDYVSRPLRPGLPDFKQMGSIDSMLDVMGLAIELSTGRTVGFVLDADTPLAARWQAVRGRLDPVGVSVPEQAPAGGFIGESDTYACRVGVWLMPDNRHDGMLETFLRTLVDEEDHLIGHAASSTKLARGLGARFSDAHVTKAIIHAWLAWQEEPGLRYGTAIRARYFRHDSATAQVFVTWFKRLYALP